MKLSETRDILAYIEHLHEELSAAYEALDENVSDPRSHLLLDYLKAMEDKSVKSLHGYSRESINVALREWEPAELDDRIVRERLKALQHPDVRANELLDAALDIANWFDQFYAELERASTRPEQTELFASIREHASKERNRLNRNANLLNDF
jgi:hypothetical protein